MAIVKETKTELLVGNIDGVNKIFLTTKSISGTLFKSVINGFIFANSADPRFGWSILSPQAIELTTAPLAGDTVAGIYEFDTDINVTADLDDWRIQFFKPV